MTPNLTGRIIANHGVIGYAGAFDYFTATPCQMWLVLLPSGDTALCSMQDLETLAAQNP